MKKSKTLVVTKKDYVKELASGVSPEDAMKPGKYKFHRRSRRTEMAPDAREPHNIKVRTNIHLDLDILNFFKERAAQPGALPYQTQINAELRKLMEAANNTDGDAVKVLREATTLIQSAIRSVQRQ